MTDELLRRLRWNAENCATASRLNMGIDQADAADEIERLRDELDGRKRQQAIMYSCLEDIRDGQDFDGCKMAAALVLKAVRQITADMMDVPRDSADTHINTT